MINNSYYQIDLWIYLGDTHHMHFQTPSPFLTSNLVDCLLGLKMTVEFACSVRSNFEQF